MMIAPELQPLIDKAVSEVGSASEGALSLSSRKSIWAKMAELSADSEQARKRLTQLDSLCVKRVMDVWSRVFPSDQGPEEMLQLALQVVVGKIDETKARRLSESFYVDVVDNRDYKASDSNAMLVGHAATATVRTALFGVKANLKASVERDEDLEPESYEPGYLAASAYAGGLIGEGNAERRREFWLWYLRDALSLAMEV